MEEPFIEPLQLKEWLRRGSTGRICSTVREINHHIASGSQLLLAPDQIRAGRGVATSNWSQLATRELITKIDLTPERRKNWLLYTYLAVL